MHKVGRGWETKSNLEWPDHADLKVRNYFRVS